MLGPPKGLLTPLDLETKGSISSLSDPQKLHNRASWLALRLGAATPEIGVNLVQRGLTKALFPNV